MEFILKDAWEEYKRRRMKRDRVYGSLTREAIRMSAEAYYIDCVFDYYLGDANINWNTGEVYGELLALPPGELR